MKDTLFLKVKRYVTEHNMLDPHFDGKWAVVAGVSGGADSMAMLDILRRLQKEWGFDLSVVHVNHGIRGSEAMRDQEMVEDICRKWEITCCVYEYDVPSLSAQWKMGHEETGRLVRREAFQCEREKYEKKGFCVKTALAHNQNDLAETMLHNLARGAGIRGLSGMRAVSGKIIRPVLCLKRAEIDNYVKERKICFVQDSTNLTDDYTRNRIRHHIVPAVEAVNAQAVSHMAETSEMLAEAESYLKEQSRVILKMCEQEDGSYLFTEDFFKQEIFIKKYVIMEALQKLAGKQKDLAAVHVRQVLELYESQNGRRIELPCRICAGKCYQGIVLEKRKDFQDSRKEEQDLWKGKKWEIPVPGVADCPGGRIETKIFEYSGQKILEKKYTKWLDYDTIESKVSLRTRHTGDYMVINQAGNRKKLTRCMIDDKIPQECRDSVLLLACESEILWMIGGRISENYKITPKTKHVLEIKYQGGK